MIVIARTNETFNSFDFKLLITQSPKSKPRFALNLEIRPAQQRHLAYLLLKQLLYNLSFRKSIMVTAGFAEFTLFPGAKVGASAGKKVSSESSFQDILALIILREYHKFLI
jgi:hypothetical protein